LPHTNTGGCAGVRRSDQRHGFVVFQIFRQALARRGRADRIKHVDLERALAHQVLAERAQLGQSPGDAGLGLVLRGQPGEVHSQDISINLIELRHALLPGELDELGDFVRVVFDRVWRSVPLGDEIRHKAVEVVS
jgi:hypothetical protein